MLRPRRRILNQLCVKGALIHELESCEGETEGIREETGLEFGGEDGRGRWRSIVEFGLRSSGLGESRMLSSAKRPGGCCCIGEDSHSAAWAVETDLSVSIGGQTSIDRVLGVRKNVGIDRRRGQRSAAASWRDARRRSSVGVQSGQLGFKGHDLLLQGFHHFASVGSTISAVSLALEAGRTRRSLSFVAFKIPFACERSLQRRMHGRKYQISNLQVLLKWAQAEHTGCSPEHFIRFRRQTRQAVAARGALNDGRRRRVQYTSISVL